MAVDNIHTLGRLDVRIVEVLIERFCEEHSTEWKECFRKDADGNCVFDLERADACFERYSMPQELLMRLRLIHEIGNTAGRDYIERMARAEGVELRRKEGRWNPQNYVGWLLAGDADGHIYPFLEKVAFRKNTEKRVVYSEAVAKGREGFTVGQLPAEKLEEVRTEYADQLFNKNRIFPVQKKAVRVFQYVEGDRLLLVIRYPGDLDSQVGCTTAGDWRSFVFNPGCYDSVYLEKSGSAVLMSMNVQKRESETREVLRMSFGTVLFGDGNAFRQAEKVLTLDPIGKVPLDKLFNKNDKDDKQIAGLTALRIHAMKYRDLRTELGDAAIITIEADGERDLRGSKRLKMFEPEEFGDSVEPHKVVVKYRMSFDQAEYTLELSERAEKKYLQKHAQILEKWLKAKGFMQWIV